MYEFHELDRFQIKGRGVSICVENPHDPELWDPGILVGKEVLIDGVVHVCRGVETFAIFRSETSPYTYDFAMLI